MKRSSLFMLLLLPALSACSIEDDYYMNDYRDYTRAGVRVEKSRPTSRHYYESSPDNHHSYRNTNRRYHSHDHSSTITRESRQQHAHPSQAAPRTHGHYSEEKPEVQAPVNSNNHVHGHE